METQKLESMDSVISLCFGLLFQVVEHQRCNQDGAELRQKKSYGCKTFLSTIYTVSQIESHWIFPQGPESSVRI